MAKFKAGDRVVRASAWRDAYWLRACDRAGVTAGEIVTVADVSSAGSSLRIEELGDSLWASGCFRHAYVAASGQDVPGPMHDAVKRPKHYILLDTEAITLIASGLTQEQFYGYCLGNAMKYRLRAGKKDDLAQDIGKAEEYELLYEQHKHLCRKGGTHHG